MFFNGEPLVVGFTCGPLWTCERARGVKALQIRKQNLQMILKNYSCKDLEAILKIFKVHFVVGLVVVT